MFDRMRIRPLGSSAMFSTICLCAVGFAAPLFAQVTLVPIETINVSAPAPALGGTFFALEDMTGDGRDDLIVTNGADIEVYAESAGTYSLVGTLTLPAVTATGTGGGPGGNPGGGPGGTGTGGIPGTINSPIGFLGTTADLDGDGDIDVIIRFSGGYEIVLGNGLGSLTHGGTFDGVNDTGEVLVGDFNGDTNADIATVQGGLSPIMGLSAVVAIRLGDGAGNFQAPIVNDLVGVGTFSGTVIDLDENGRDDFVLSGLAELVFAFTDATGTITATNTYPAGAGDAPQELETVDLNGDGHDDVIFACPVMNRVGVLVQDGTGSLGTLTEHVFFGSPLSVETGDLDGDLALDLVISSTSGLEYSLGDGLGAFGAATVQPLGNSFARIAVGDLNIDTLADVAVLSGTTVTLLGNATTTTSPITAPFCRGDASSDGRVDVGDGIRILGYLFISGAPPIVCMDSADANDDGDVDLADAIHLLNFLFVAGSDVVPAPGVSTCGADPSADALDCPSSVCP